MVALRILAVAAASGRIGYIFLAGDELKDWRVAYAAAKSPAKAAKLVRSWINQLGPDVVVSEDVNEAAKKGKRTKAVIKAVVEASEHCHVLSVSLVRSHDFANKYEEAAYLAGQYPEIRAWLPERRHFYDNEPSTTVLFEALSLGEKLRRAGPLGLASEMG